MTTTLGEAIVKRAEKDPEYKKKVIEKLEDSSEELKERLRKVERAIRALKKIK